jgi:hypothetical protein
MLSAAQRQRKLAKKAKVRKQVNSTKLEMTRALRAVDRLGPFYSLLIIDKCEEMFGDPYGGYSADQHEEVIAIVNGYTPEQREVAIKLATSLRWETPEEDFDTDVHHFELRQQQRREQGRGI